MEFCKKSDEKANASRQLGNAHYGKKEYIKALFFYNESIAYACSKSNLSLGYGNRSAVYFEIQCYDECIKNIEWARENDYPADKLSKIMEREDKCKKFILEGKKNITEDPWNFFKLSYPANEKIPWIVDCLELKTTKKYGRGIYATKDLNAGDILCIEDPPIHILNSDGFYKHCNNCFKTCMMNLIPCIKTASMMFCSTECMEIFYSKCEEIELSLKNDMKMLSTIAAPFEGREKLDKFIKETNLKDQGKTIFDYDFSNPEDPDYDKNRMTCLLSLKSIENDFSNERSLAIYKFVSKKTANLILGLVPINNFVCAYGSGDYKNPFSDGSNIPLFRSLINHSCVSNVNFIYIDNKEVTFVMKPIKAGEQLMYCYHNKYSFHQEMEKEQMMEKHNFICDCQDCISGFLKYPTVIIPPPIQYMSRKNFTKGIEYLKDGWKIINANKSSQGIIDESRKRCLQTLYALAYYATFPH